MLFLSRVSMVSKGALWSCPRCQGAFLAPIKDLVSFFPDLQLLDSGFSKRLGIREVKGKWVGV